MTKSGFEEFRGVTLSKGPQGRLKAVHMHGEPSGYENLPRETKVDVFVSLVESGGARRPAWIDRDRAAKQILSRGGTILSGIGLGGTNGRISLGSAKEMALDPVVSYVRVSLPRRNLNWFQKLAEDFGLQFRDGPVAF